MNDEMLILWEKLNQKQKERFIKWMSAFNIEKEYKNHTNEFSDDFQNNFGDRLITHHFNSSQPLTKTLFEHAFNDALNETGIPSSLAESRTNPGHDITINNVRSSLKTEAARDIKEKSIHISKWMELGKGEWDLNLLLGKFLSHLNNYERIFTLRFFRLKDNSIKYQLVEIPKSLLIKARDAELEIKENSIQNPKPGYGYVKDKTGVKMFSLYFDGGTERKLRIHQLDVNLCHIHMEWVYILPSA